MLASDKDDLDALLQHLARPRSKSREDLLIAVAAHSLAMQLEYWIGDMGSWYKLRRDVGLAKMANFITSELDAPRVCLWAHNMHTSERRSELRMGGHLTDSLLNRIAWPEIRYLMADRCCSIRSFMTSSAPLHQFSCS